jgi:hypothetical protein
MKRQGGDTQVLVVGTGSVLDEAIKGLLMREPEFQVATATYADSVTLFRSAARVSLDVIVISEAGPRDWDHISELLRSVSPQDTLRVIVARPDDNVVEVYDKQCLEVTRNDDLITLISRHR